MSKGPGRIERAIEAAFKSNPDGYFSVPDLAHLIYERKEVTRSERVAIQRAAHRVAERLHWTTHRASKRGAELIFVNALSLRSYGFGWIRARHGGGGHHEYMRGLDGKIMRGPWITETERITKKFETDDDMKPGGIFALQVEHNIAVVNGETERAAQIEIEIQRECEATWAALAEALARSR